MGYIKKWDDGMTGKRNVSPQDLMRCDKPTLIQALRKSCGILDA